MPKFYIPRRRSPALDIAGLALRYADIKQRGELSKRELDLRERISKAEYGWGDDTGGETGLAYRREARLQRGTDIAERYTDIAEREAERKGQTAIAQWERRMSDAPQPANLIALKDNMPMFGPAINTILEGIQNGKINSRWDAYHLLKQNETIHLKTARDQVEKEITKLTKEGKHTQAAQLGQLYNALKPGFLEDFFGFPKEFREGRPEIGLEAPGEEKRYTLKPGEKLVGPQGKEVARGLTEKEAPGAGKTKLAGKDYLINEKGEIVWQRPPTPQEIADWKWFCLTDKTKNDEGTIRTYAPLYNAANKRNEVIYWDTSLLGRDQGKAVKLPKAAIKAGWTPAKIQSMVDRRMAESIEALLKDLGIIK